ncbi:MAG TPA: divergent polysaccharide deacetylase family protein [Candidatus Acidoferrum sp.]|nr:divergent polysaccharide deacetylase family protein [Candidatus Acidoferrum sp.]
MHFPRGSKVLFFRFAVSRSSPWSSKAFLTVLGAVLLAVGCQKQEARGLKPVQVHAITREMAKAATGFAKSPESTLPSLQFDGARANRADQLSIILPPFRSEPARRQTVTRLIQSLDRVATTHGLTRDAETEAGALLRLNYRRAGLITQSVHIIAPLGAPASSSGASGTASSAGVPCLAIILDDLGQDRAAADAIFALPYPLTISVLPNHIHSTEIAEEARRRGYQVMLHLPMQSVGDETPEARELRPSMAPADIPALFEEMMQSVPTAAGVNNHQGSQATADASLMQQLMPLLQQWNLFYVDSRTTAATVAYDTAQRSGVRSAFRNVPFLDDDPEVSAVRRQLELAFHDARKKGAALAIGHPRSATLQALREFLPQAQARGVRLVYASDLVH